VYKWIAENTRSPSYVTIHSRTFPSFNLFDRISSRLFHGMITLINVIAKRNQRVYGKQDFLYVF